MKDKAPMIAILIIAILMGSVFAIKYTNLENPIMDSFADTVSDEEIIEWINSTQWFNSTEYVNTTEYINTTVWINNTIWINSTEYINYPFIAGWNSSSSPNYVRYYRYNGYGPTQFRVSYYNQVSESISNTGYHSYSANLVMLNNLHDNFEMTDAQYDGAIIQIWILNNGLTGGGGP